MNKKLMPYLIFGVPLLIGGFFLFKYFKAKKSGATNEGGVTPPTTPSTTPSTSSSSSSTSSSTYTQDNQIPFKKGSKGGYVISIQKKLGISTDGLFGSQTQSSVIAFQKKNNLSPDGVVGNLTWKALFGADFPNEKKAPTITNPLTSTQVKNLAMPLVSESTSMPKVSVKEF